jgi:hypothetical protein
MAKLSQAQIEMYARSAGMSNPQIMAAIAMAESGGNPRAHNPIPPDNSYGLWQINMLGAMGPARRKEFGITSNDALFNPAVNARAAAKILASQGPKAWSTYTNGAYKKYLKSGSTATGAGFFGDDDPLDGFWDDLFGDQKRGPGSEQWEEDMGDLPSVGPDLGGLTDLAKLGVKFGEWSSNPRNWLDVVYVLGGGILILVTISATVRQQVTAPLKNIAKAVKK